MGAEVPGASHPILPMLHLSSEDLPEIENWKVGKKYKIMLEVRHTGISESMERKGTMMGAFEIHRAGDYSGHGEKE